MASFAERIGSLVMGLLPDSVVARVAGAPTMIRGRSLDPRLQLIAGVAAKAPALSAQSPVEARASADSTIAVAAGRPRPLESVTDRTVPGADGHLPARLHRPFDLDGPRPLLLYFHQGGCVIGNIDWCDVFCSILAETTRCPVLAVGYRKGPEHRFPAAQEDALAVYEWACEHADEVGGDPRRIGVGGDSAGGGMSAMIAQEAKRRGLQRPLLQLLVYPWLVAYADNDAYRDFGDAYPLSADSMRWFLHHYLNDDAERDDLRLSPSLETDLRELAPALVYTAGFDVLCDEGDEYAARLETAGVPVTHRRYDSLCHSFTMLGGASPAAERALLEIARDVERTITGGRV